MLVGTVTKQEGIWWSAHCDIAGVFTQGKSKVDAMRALADAFEDVINRPGFKATVTALDGDEVRVEASDPALLLGVVLRYQREAHPRIDGRIHRVVPGARRALGHADVTLDPGDAGDADQAAQERDGFARRIAPHAGT